MSVTVIYWRDIPAQVMTGTGRSAVRIPLSERFQEAIDRAATRAGLIGSDEYTAEWRRQPTDGDDPGAVAERLEVDFTQNVLEALIKSRGKKP